MSTTYTIQLRYLPSNYFGYKVGPNHTTRSMFDTTDKLNQVYHYDSYDEAVSHLRATNPHISIEYLMVTAHTEDESTEEQRLAYEVWVTIPLVDKGQRIYVLAGSNSLTLLTSPDLPALQWQDSEQASRYAESIGLVSYSVMQVDTTY